MRVKDLADLAGTTVRTIRYYHHLGLLAVPDEGTPWRSYGFTHLTRLMRIRWLVDAGVPLADAPALLRPLGDADERATAGADLDAMLTAIDDRIEVLQRQRERLWTLRARLHDGGRLSPLPPAIIGLYDRLLARPVDEETRAAMRREREVLELLWYRDHVPNDLLRLAEAATDDDIDAFVALWDDYVQTLNAGEADRAAQQVRVVNGIVDCLMAIDPQAATGLLRTATDGNRAGIRATLHLAFPAATHKRFIDSLLRAASERTERSKQGSNV